MENLDNYPIEKIRETLDNYFNLKESKSLLFIDHISLIGGRVTNKSDMAIATEMLFKATEFRKSLQTYEIY